LRRRIGILSGSRKVRYKVTSKAGGGEKRVRAGLGMLRDLGVGHAHSHGLLIPWPSMVPHERLRLRTNQS
jgi:hypothetical protein